MHKHLSPIPLFMRLSLVPLLPALWPPTSALHSAAEAAVRHRFLCFDHSGGKLCIGECGTKRLLEVDCIGTWTRVLIRS